MEKKDAVRRPRESQRDAAGCSSAGHQGSDGDIHIGLVAASGTGGIGRHAAAGQTTCLAACLQLDISFP